MNATVTEDIELILLWRESGESAVRFALSSNSEFSISARVRMDRQMNYQGPTIVSFETMCYGADLKGFGMELRKLAQGETESARFLNTGGDFEISIKHDHHQGNHLLVSEMRYRHFREIRDVRYESELVLPVGSAQEVQQTADAITEVLRLLKVDCRSLFELPQ